MKLAVAAAALVPRTMLSDRAMDRFFKPLQVPVMMFSSRTDRLSYHFVLMADLHGHVVLLCIRSATPFVLTTTCFADCLC